jgi:hypothetical protein
VPADGSGNAGFANPQTFAQGLSYTLTVPEPATLGILLFGILFMPWRRAR